MARPSSPAAASSAKPIFKNTGKLFQPFHKIGVTPEIGVGPGVYNCDGLQATITEEGRPTFISLNDRTATPATPAETRSYSVKHASVTRLDEDFMESEAPLTHEEGEELCAEIAGRIESTRLEIKTEFSTDGSPAISDDDVNFFLRSEILAKNKEKMIPLIQNALRKNEELIETELKNNPSLTPYEATLHIPKLTFHEAVTQLRSIDDEQLFAILNLRFDYDKVMRHRPYPIEIQYLKKIQTENPEANLAAIYETLISLPICKLLATCLGFPSESVATIEEDKYLNLIYLVELKQKLLDEGKPLKTVEEMTEILEQTAAFTSKNQFRGLLLGLDAELSERLTGDEFEDNVILEYLTNEVVGNRRISELPDEEKTKTIGEIFASIEGCENYPQCIAKRELGFSDEIIHATVEDGDEELLLISGADLENVNFVVELKAKKSSLTVDELVAAYSKIRNFDGIQFKAAHLGLPLEIAETITFDRGEVSYLKKLKGKNLSISEEELAATYQKLITFSDFQFGAAILGLPLKIVETYFGNETSQTWFQYLKNFKEKNPETTDEEITAKFNAILPLKSELQLRALDIGLSPASAQRFAIRSLHEEKIRILEDLKEMRPDITDQQLEDFCAAILGISNESLRAFAEELKARLDVPTPAPDAAGAGAAAVVDDEDERSHSL